VIQSGQPHYKIFLAVAFLYYRIAAFIASTRILMHGAHGELSTQQKIDIPNNNRYNKPLTAI